MSARKKVAPATVAPAAVEPKRTPTENPLVFISHDSRDADLAEAFSNLLTDASGGILKSFRSSDKKGTAGIEFGVEWYSAIMQKLDDATDVVALLTASSLNRPWILYETGVAKGKLSADQRVLGIALGVTLDEAATGPFAQFQNSPDEEDAITGLVLQLIRRHPQAAPREEAVRLQVKAFRDSIAKLLKDRKKDATPVPKPPDDTSVAKFFEEIKVLVRDVPERVAIEVNGSMRGPRGRKRRFFHPGMIEELFHHPAMREGENPALPLLIAFSMFRDDFPWLYELAAQFNRAIENGDARGVHMAHRSIINAIDMLHHSPMGEMMGIRDDESMMMLHHLARTVERYLPDMMRSPRLATTTTSTKTISKSSKAKNKPEE
jgi:hypothetical protein